MQKPSAACWSCVQLVPQRLRYRSSLRTINVLLRTINALDQKVFQVSGVGSFTLKLVHRMTCGTFNSIEHIHLS